MTHFTHTATTQQHRRAVTHQITDSHGGLCECGRDLLQPRTINSCINMQTRQAAYGSKFTQPSVMVLHSRCYNTTPQPSGQGSVLSGKCLK